MGKKQTNGHTDKWSEMNWQTISQTDIRNWLGMDKKKNKWADKWESSMMNGCTCISNGLLNRTTNGYI